MDDPQDIEDFTVSANKTKGVPMPERCFVYPLSDKIFETVCVVFILGFILNTVLLSRVLKDKKLRCTTFAVIGELAVCDIAFVITYATKTIFASVLPCMPLYEYRIAILVLECIMLGAWFSSSLHTVLIAVVRYIILCYPIRSRLWLTTRRLIVTSVCIWIFSLANGSTLLLYRDYLFVFICSSYVLSVLLITLFHVLKLYILRKRNEIDFSNVREKTTMSKMVTVVILVFVLFPLMFIGGSIARFVGLRHGPLFVEIGVIFLNLNSAINPIIYGFMSVTLRRSVLRMLRCRSPSNNKMSISNSSQISSVNYGIPDRHQSCKTSTPFEKVKNMHNFNNV